MPTIIEMIVANSSLESGTLIEHLLNPKEQVIVFGELTSVEYVVEPEYEVEYVEPEEYEVEYAPDEQPLEVEYVEPEEHLVECVPVNEYEVEYDN